MVLLAFFGMAHWIGVFAETKILGSNASVDSPSFCSNILNTVCLKSSKNSFRELACNTYSILSLHSQPSVLYASTKSPQSSRKFQSSFYKILKEKKLLLVNVLLNGFPFNGQTTGFHAATRKLELHTKQYHLTLRLFS